MTRLKKVIQTDTIILSEGKDGFWLWDETRCMNLSMRAKTSDDAFIETICYYQNRLRKVEEEYNTLKNRVDKFISPFMEELT